jgi:hypothetical protein
MMKRAILLAILVYLLNAPGQAATPVRFSVKVDLIDLANSVAQPGDIPIPVSSTNLNFEVINWSTTNTVQQHTGIFTVKFRTPLESGSVIAYDAGEVEYFSNNRWEKLDVEQEKGRRLQVLPLPLGKAVEAVRFKVMSKIVKRQTSTPQYKAVLPYFTIVPAPLINVSQLAAVSVSSVDKPSEGFQPQPWVNRPYTITDGFIDSNRNFSTAKRDKPISPDSPEWIVLSWEELKPLRGIGLFYGASEKGLGDFTVEQYVGLLEPRFSVSSNDWREIPFMKTVTGGFRANQFLVFSNIVETRGIRIISRGGSNQISIGEVVAMADGRIYKAEDRGKTIAADRVPIEFSIPAEGRVTIQIRDENNEVVANPVTGVEFPAGKNVVYWGIEDMFGAPVLKPGKYSWRGLYVPKLTVEYKFSYLPYPVASVPWQTEDRKGGWLADHEPPRTIARAGSNMWLGAFAEAGDSIVETDSDGNKLWGIDRIWVAIPAEICVDGDWYYGWCEGGWIGDNQAIIQINTKTKASRKIFQREMPPKQVTIEEMRKSPNKRGVTGFQVVGNLAFVSFQKLDVIQVFDISKGIAGPWRGFGWDIAYKQFEDQKPVLVKEINIPSPGRIRKYLGDTLITTSGKDIVTIDVRTFEVKPLITGKLQNPLGLGVDTNGNIFVGEGEPLHQVFGFSPDGKIISVLGKPGRREVGPFDENDLQEPYGVEVAADGRVWVMEFTYWPKRVSIWNPKTGICEKAIYGPTQYGGGGCVDPEDENRLFYRGLEMRRDPKTGKITPVSLYYRPDSVKYARFSSDDFPEYAFRSEGRLWMTSFMAPHEHPSLVLWLYDEKQKHVKPVAAIGSAVALRVTFGEKPANKGDRKDWQNTDFLTNYVNGYNPENKFFTWTDLNDDGFVQVNELKFGKITYQGRLLTHAYAGWNWRMNDKFEAAANAGYGRMIFFKPSGKTKAGYPIYEVPKETFEGSGEALGVDSKGNAIVLGGPITCVQQDGKIRWRYRNDWPGLHAGHRTTARGDEPGVLIAPTRIWGIVPVNDEIGDVVVFNSNLGCTYLMTCDDGLYIDRVFRDQRVGLLWRMPYIPPPDVLAETSLYDEHFGGTFQKVRSADESYKYYYIVGKNHCTVVELKGLEKVKRLSGGTFTVTPEQIAAAQERKKKEVAKTIEPKIYEVPKVKPNVIQIDGDDREWTWQRIDGFALAYDDEKLYVLFKGKDDRATFENKGENLYEIFKTGDVVDVMLQTRLGLNPNRTEAGVGDIRLSFAMFKGKPVCVLYDYKVEGYKGERVPFSSPWRTVWCDRVVELTGAEIKVRRGVGEYTLEAAVPLKDIHFNPSQVRETRGDVGRVLSDQTGSAVSSRVYWSNKYTAIMSDLPSEASVSPNLWGVFRFKE